MLLVLILLMPVELTTYWTLWLTHTVYETKMTPPIRWLMNGFGVRVRVSYSRIVHSDDPQLLCRINGRLPSLMPPVPLMLTLKLKLLLVQQVCAGAADGYASEADTAEPDKDEADADGDCADAQFRCRL